MAFTGVRLLEEKRKMIMMAGAFLWHWGLLSTKEIPTFHVDILMVLMRSTYTGIIQRSDIVHRAKHVNWWSEHSASVQPLFSIASYVLALGPALGQQIHFSFTLTTVYVLFRLFTLNKVYSITQCIVNIPENKADT